MFFYFILITSIASSLWSMNPIVTLKDDHNNVAVITDVKTLQELKTLSTALAARPVEEITEENQKKYTVLTGLPKKLITFLLQLNANKDIKVIYPALQSQAISLEGITQDDINTLGLPTNLQKAFNSLLILETENGIYLPLQKDVLMYFFGIIPNQLKDFPGQIILPLQVNSSPMIILYNLVKKLGRPETLSPQEWTNLKEAIKTALTTSKPTNPQLLILLKTADFLAAKPFLLLALYELYKANFSETDWQKELKQYPFLKNIPRSIESDYASIERLLADGIYDFYTIGSEANPTRSGEMMMTLHVFGTKIYDLKGLNLIPQIKNCQSLIIENTSISAIKKGDFNGLNHLLDLNLSNNKNLVALEPLSFSLYALETLKIKGSNLSIIADGIFRFPNLTLIWFSTNNIHTFKANWAKNIYNLTRIIIDEPSLQTLENGWLNGLSKLQIIQLNRAINNSVVTQIRQDIIGYPRPPIVFIPGSELQ